MSPKCDHLMFLLHPKYSSKSRIFNKLFLLTATEEMQQYSELSGGCGKKGGLKPIEDRGQGVPVCRAGEIWETFWM